MVTGIFVFGSSMEYSVNFRAPALSQYMSASSWWFVLRKRRKYMLSLAASAGAYCPYCMHIYIGTSYGTHGFCFCWRKRYDSLFPGFQARKTRALRTIWKCTPSLSTAYDPESKSTYPVKWVVFTGRNAQIPSNSGELTLQPSIDSFCDNCWTGPELWPQRKRLIFRHR